VHVGGLEELLSMKAHVPKGTRARSQRAVAAVWDVGHDDIFVSRIE
jgi:hypothetical protein